VMFCRKISWKPGQKQVESVIVRREAQREAADSALAEQVKQRRAFGRFGTIFRLRSAALNEFPLDVGEALVLARIAIPRISSTPTGSLNCPSAEADALLAAPARSATL